MTLKSLYVDFSYVLAGYLTTIAASLPCKNVWILSCLFNIWGNLSFYIEWAVFLFLENKDSILGTGLLWANMEVSGQMIQWLKMLLFHSTWVWSPISIFDGSLPIFTVTTMGQMLSSLFCEQLHTCAHMYAETNTFTYFKIQNWMFKI